MVLTRPGAARAHANGVSRGLGGVALTRVAGLLLSALTTFIATGLVISGAGSARFGVISLVATMSSLFAFADLGLGAAIVNAAVSASSDQPSWTSTCRSALRVTGISAAVLSVAALLTLKLGGWTRLLGVNTHLVEHLPGAATIIVVLIALGIPLGLGQRVLLGLGKQRLAVAIQATTGLVSLPLVVGVYVAHGPVYLYALASPMASTVAAALGLIVAEQKLKLAGLPSLLHSVRHAETSHKARVIAVAGPMLMLTISEPIALYSDRLVLSHFSNLRALATYSLASQLAFPVLGVISATGQALWPRFAMLRHEGTGPRRDLLALLRIFSLGGLAVGGAVTLVGPLAAHVISDGRTPAGFTVFGCFGLLILATAVHYPSGMFLTDSRGLRRQALLNVIMLAGNLPLSIVLAKRIGASGPVLASAVTFIVLYALPVMATALQRAGSNDVQVDHIMDEVISAAAGGNFDFSPALAFIGQGEQLVAPHLPGRQPTYLDDQRPRVNRWPSELPQPPVVTPRARNGLWRVLIIVTWAYSVPTSFASIYESGRGSILTSISVTVTPKIQLATYALLLLTLLASAGLIVMDINAQPESRSVGRLLLALSPWAAMELATIHANGTVGLAFASYPLIAVAFWLRRPNLQVLSTLGVLTALTATISLGLSVVRPALVTIPQSVTDGKAVIGNSLLAGPFEHSNTFGLALALGIPFVFLIQTTVWRRISLAVTGLALIETVSRTALLAVIFAMITVVIARRASRAGIAQISYLVAGAGVVTIVIVPLRVTRIQSFSGRGQIWLASRQLWDQHPLFGQGPDFYPRVAQLDNDFGPFAFHGHNTLIHFMTTAGAIGLLGVGLIMLGLVWRAVVWARCREFIPLAWTITFLWVGLFEVVTDFRNLSQLGYVSWLPALTILLGTMPAAEVNSTKEARLSADAKSVEAPQSVSIG